MKSDRYNTELNIELSSIFLIKCAMLNMTPEKIDQRKLLAIRRGHLFGSVEMEREVYKNDKNIKQQNK